MEDELGPEEHHYTDLSQEEIEATPEPGPPVTIGLDGGYIRGRERTPGGYELLRGARLQEYPAGRRC